jgi:hypothetical protein
VQRPGDHPSIAAVVARSRCDKYAGAEHMPVALRQHGGGRAPGALHERSELDAGTDGSTVPAVGLFRGEDGDGQGEE